MLPPQARLGVCPKCGSWLGQSLTADECDDEDEWPRWVAHSVGNLLAGAPSLLESISSERIQSAIGAYADFLFGGNLAALARMVRQEDSTIANWRYGKTLPTLEHLLEVSYLLEITPLTFLTGETMSIYRPSNKLRSLPDRSRRKPGKVFDVAAVRRELEVILASDECPPPSVAEVARRLGYDSPRLFTRCPEISRQISARYLAHRKRQSERRMAILIAEVEQATRLLHQEGRNPTAARVAELLTRPSEMRLSAASDALRRTLRELGLKA